MPAESLILRVGSHAYDSERGGGARFFRTKVDRLAYGVLAGEEALSQGLVKDHGAIR